MTIQSIVLHHTATSGIGDGGQEWSAIMTACKQRRGSPYICDYHYGIGPTGVLFYGQPISHPCWHSGDDLINQSSLAVACIGNFQETTMPVLQLNRLLGLIRELKNTFPGARFIFHFEIVSTLCPGKHYPIKEVMKIVKSTSRFWDVPDTHLFYPAIELVSSKGIMKGDLEGSFRPDEGITRGEMAQVLANALSQRSLLE